MNVQKIGFVRTATAAPKLTVADPANNVNEIIKLITKAEESGVGLIVFPELCLTGSTCADLFFQPRLYQAQEAVLSELLSYTEGRDITVVLGLYVRAQNKLYNCSALIQNGMLLGVSPQPHQPSGAEESKGRWFSDGDSAPVFDITIAGQTVPFGSLLFKDEAQNITLGLVTGEDLTAAKPAATALSQAGAQIICNPTAGAEIVGSTAYHRNLIIAETGRCGNAFVSASAGVTESTSDAVFGGLGLIAENGSLLKESKRFSQASTLTFIEIDPERISFEQTQRDAHLSEYYSLDEVAIAPIRLVTSDQTLERSYSQTPFLADTEEETAEHCEEIFAIQAAALAKRIVHSHAKKAIVGISGGLDSTLALLVSVAACKLIDKPTSDIVAITMPGFGTTGRTYNNALTIMKTLGTDVREISIRDSVLQHFKDIGQSEDNHDVTYENAQARERTQILMDVANMEGGFVVGTGDLSEEALGWCTYNGDHMSMYNVNACVPKTLVRHVVRWVKEHRLAGPAEDPTFSSDNSVLAEALQSILDTPISPELLPPTEDDEMTQITEDRVGPYDLHDFFIYHTVRHGMSPEKLLYTATQAFAGKYDEEFIAKWQQVFYRRFITQQYKRNCAADAPKVGSVCLAPRDGFVMPSDAGFNIWMA